MQCHTLWISCLTCSNVKCTLCNSRVHISISKGVHHLHQQQGIYILFYYPLQEQLCHQSLWKTKYHLILSQVISHVCASTLKIKLAKELVTAHKIYLIEGQIALMRLVISMQSEYPFAVHIKQPSMTCTEIHHYICPDCEVDITCTSKNWQVLGKQSYH